MTLDFVSALYFVAFVLALFLTALVCQQTRDRTASLMLTGVILVLTYWLLNGLTLHSNLYEIAPHLHGWLPAAPWLLGPFMYAYSRRLADGEAYRPVRLLPHLIPAAVITGLALPGIFASGEMKVAHIRMMAEPHQHTALGVGILIAAKLQMITYLGLSWRTLTGLAQGMPEGRKGAVDWQQRLCLLLMTAEAIWSLLFLVHVSAGLFDFLSVTKHWALFLSISVMLIAYSGLQVPPHLAGVATLRSVRQKYARAALAKTTACEISALIRDALEREQLYLRTDLNLGSLSAHLSLTRHLVSQVINEEMGTSFYGLVNGYRVAHAKDLMAEPAAPLSIERLAAECGFNNRVTFNKAFKEFEGMSPSAYRQAISVQPVRA